MLRFQLVKAGENKVTAKPLKEKAEKKTKSTTKRYQLNPPSFFSKAPPVKQTAAITKKGRGRRAAEQHALAVV